MTPSLKEPAALAAAERGGFVLSVSGGYTPWLILRALAKADVPWSVVHVVQIDERVAPAGNPDRNLTHLRESPMNNVPLAPEQIHDMPVQTGGLDAAAARYSYPRSVSQARRRCSTWLTWVLVLTGILLPWSAIRLCRLQMLTLL